VAQPSRQLQEESTGTIRYFGFAAILAKMIHQPKYLCIDEIETSLHAHLLQHFLKTFLLGAERSQLLFTTHDTALLANTDLFRKENVWFTDKHETGYTDLYSAADIQGLQLEKL
jgi:AAA15 family ATPase/GTPase